MEFFDKMSTAQRMLPIIILGIIACVLVAGFIGFVFGVTHEFPEKTQPEITKVSAQSIYEIDNFCDDWREYFRNAVTGQPSCGQCHVKCRGKK